MGKGPNVQVGNSYQLIRDKLANEREAAGSHPHGVYSETEQNEFRLLGVKRKGPVALETPAWRGPISAQ